MSKRNRHSQKNTLNSQAASSLAPVNPLDFPSTLPDIQYYDILLRTAGSAVLRVRTLAPHLSEDDLIDLLAFDRGMLWTNYSQPGSPDVQYLGAQYSSQITVPGMSVVQTAVIISWPRQEGGGMVERLRSLKQEVDDSYSPWSAIVGAALAAERCYHGLPGSAKCTDWTPTASAFAMFTGALAQPDGRAIGKKEAHRIAWDCLQSVPASFQGLLEGYNLDAISTALVLLELGELLWEPHTRQHMARRCYEYYETPPVWNFLARLADGWLYLVVRDHMDVETCGGRLRCGPSEACKLHEWKQVIELERRRIPPQALHYLKSHRNPQGPYLEPDDLPGYDPVYGDALAEQLLADAHQNAVFVPSGAFRLSLPAHIFPDLFNELYLWTDGKGMWVLPKPGEVIFYWRPEHPSALNPLDWDEVHLSAIHTILSALWRDLVVGGEQVFAQLSHERVASPASKPFDRLRAGSRRKPSGKSKRPSTLYLPSPRKLDLEGHCTWGTPDEVEKIRRRAHQVRGHVRRLLPGQKAGSQAKENAERFGFLIPSGHTFVRPHTAGLKSEDEEIPETRIVACGLASVLVMGNNRSMEAAK